MRYQRAVFHHFRIEHRVVAASKCRLFYSPGSKLEPGIDCGNMDASVCGRVRGIEMRINLTRAKYAKTFTQFTHLKPLRNRLMRK